MKQEVKEMTVGQTSCGYGMSVFDWTPGVKAVRLEKSDDCGFRTSMVLTKSDLEKALRIVSEGKTSLGTPLVGAGKEN